MAETVLKKKPEEEMAPPGKLTGVKIVKVAETATKRAQENAIKVAEGISDYFEKAGAKKMQGVRKSELGYILFG